MAIKVVSNPYSDKNSIFRKGVEVEGHWPTQAKDFIRQNGIKALYLNSTKGWLGTDYSFLAELDTIEELFISSSSATGLASIEKMLNLREINLTFSSQDRINFSGLKKLEKCYLYWWGGADSIFECVSLRSAYFDGLKLKNYDLVSRLVSLSELTIANSSIDSVNWLVDMGVLEKIELLNCKKISNFSPIGECRKLKSLTIRGNKNIKNVSFLKDLDSLEVLIISDNGSIDSISDISALKNLKAASFAGSTTIVDGDLSVLERLPKLSMLMFAPRKHYTHRLIKPWNWNNFDVPDVLLEKK